MKITTFDPLIVTTEAEAILEKHGFVNTNAGQRRETETSQSEFMTSPSCFSINLVKHLK